MANKTEGIAPITLIKGTEPVLVDRTIRELRRRLQEHSPEAEVTTIRAAEYQKGELSTLVSSSLFAEEQVLIVEDLGAANDDFQTDFLNYIASPLPEVWVLLRQAGGQRGARVTAALKKAGFPLIQRDAPKGDRQKGDLVRDEVSEAGGSITPEGVSALVSAVRGELGELLAAARQLVDDSGGHVTDDVVHQFFRGRVETTGFEVAEALARRDGPGAVLLARRAFATGTPPVLVVSALAQTFRGMAKVKVPGISPRDMGMAPWQIDRAKGNSSAWSDDELGHALRIIAEADCDVKGLSRVPDGAVEVCILKVARIIQRGSRRTRDRLGN